MARESFDLVVHKRNKKGKVVSVNPYRLLCRGNKKLFERPPRSGNLYYADGTLAEAGPEMKKQLDEAKLRQEAKEAKDALLEREIAAMAAKAKAPVTEAPGKAALNKTESKAQGAK